MRSGDGLSSLTAATVAVRFSRSGGRTRSRGLTPLDPRVTVLGASSDHLVVDVDDLPEPPRLGDEIAFVPNYAATLAAFTSPYVGKRFLG